MANPGEYSDRVKLWQHTYATNADTGDRENVFTEAGYLWSVVDVESSRVQADYGSEQTGSTATIRVRNWPNVSALDRLELPEWAELWVIDSLRRGDNELIIEAHRYDGLSLEGTP